MTTATRPARRSTLRFLLHFAEMMVAMLLGMLLLGPLWTWLATGLTERADIGSLVMATDMALGMTLWMRVRRHSWPRIIEMSLAMYVPFVLLLVPFWLGAISGMTLMMVGHILMVPVMIVAMLWRRHDYCH